MITLPTNIEDALLALLHDSDAAWVTSAASLSLRYRAERSKQTINYTKDVNDVLGYIALRVPCTYSQIYGALASIRELNPSWKPLKVLDIGSGPGTATWAAAEIFSTITASVSLERNKDFVMVGKAISEALPDVTMDWRSVDLADALPELDETFDLVIVANVLNEMNGTTKNAVLEFANKHTKGIIVIIEPGTPYGFEVINLTAKKFTASEKQVIAPYIQNSFINSADVNFVQRIKRPEFQKRVRHLLRKIDQTEKSRILPPSDWEESKYYYIAYATFKSELSPSKRLIEKPQLFKPYVDLKVLTKDGIKTERIMKKDKNNYRMSKKLRWGELLI